MKNKCRNFFFRAVIILSFFFLAPQKINSQENSASNPASYPSSEVTTQVPQEVTTQTPPAQEEEAPAQEPTAPETPQETTWQKDSPPATEKELAEVLNNFNFAELFNHIIGNRYSSHGCVHLSPTSIYILYSTLPVGTTLVIQPYNVVFDEKGLANVPYLETLAKNEGDLKKLKDKFKNPKDIRIEALPRSEKWILYFKDKPLAQFDISTGPSESYFMFLGKDEAGNYQYDELEAGPTSPGSYQIVYLTDYLYAPSYRDTTIIPQGALIKKIDGKWFFEKDKKWYACPVPVADDLERLIKNEDTDYYYYDIVYDQVKTFFECRWSSHDFGKYVIGWRSPTDVLSDEVAHTNGILVKEQIDLAKDLSLLIFDALNVDDDFDLLISRHPNFSLYKNYAEFLKTPDRFRANEELVLYKLYTGWLIFPEEEKLVEPGIFAAFSLLQTLDKEKWTLTESENFELIKIGAAQKQDEKYIYDLKKIRGILAYVKKNKTGVEKFAFWFNYLKENWPRFAPLKEIFIRYLKTKPEMSDKLKQNVIFQLIRARADFKTLTPLLIQDITQKETEKSNSDKIYE